jgi:hypothetical protein
MDTMLKAVVETIDAVPEAVRGFYQETDGKFFLQVEPVDGYALEDVSGLKNTLGKEMTLRKRLEKDVLKFKDLDPDRAREALAKLEELGNIDPLKEADKIVSERLEAAKKQLLEKHGEELKTRDGRIGQLTKTVESLLIDQAATAALAEAKGSVELLLPHVQRHTRVREADGKYFVDVVDKDGNARIGNAKGDPMTIADLVQEMRKSETFGRAFDGSGQSGGGKPPGNGGGGSPQFKRRSDFKTEKDRADFINANGGPDGGGLEAYDKLPA